ncbi:DNA adenine methylase [Plantactinospora solaniradicis]|uniref:site-specific DNA-methyltransferase (adenine-specific) n=1 Tax=Plantactinospora solaniradicis TaxID=1723736 RepID=A0ABW1K9E6_9ACTN
MTTPTSAPLEVRAWGRTAAVSPLRYPGGKAALANLFNELIGRPGTESTRYVEPYAGGAGAGIVLLKQDVVQELVINDIDPAVYCFWLAVTSQPQEFASKISDTPLNVDEWRAQKQIYRESDESDPFSLGFAFFYLNRTNRSGILHAGPIGGVRQNGNYKIDARFNRDQLAERVAAIGALATRITVLSRDGMSVVKEFVGDSSTFIYIDPPYVEMGSSLYLNALTHRDHSELAAVLDQHPERKWVVTYDPSDLIRQLYRKHDVREFQLSYSAHRTGKAHELFIASRPVSRHLPPVKRGPA